MSNENLPKFSAVLASKLRRLRKWLMPDPDDHLAIKIVKTILKSVVMLVLLLISPVLLIGFALIFIGLM